MDYYSDYEMDMYPIYMEYVEDEINKSKLPKRVKKQMMEKRHLHKGLNGMWFLYECGYTLEFIPFQQWLLQEERNEKLEQLLNG